MILKYKLEPKVPYLGMDIDFSGSGEVRITMNGMADDICVLTCKKSGSELNCCDDVYCRRFTNSKFCLAQ